MPLRLDAVPHVGEYVMVWDYGPKYSEQTPEFAGQVLERTWQVTDTRMSGGKTAHAKPAITVLCSLGSAEEEAEDGQ